MTIGETSGYVQVIVIWRYPLWIFDIWVITVITILNNPHTWIHQESGVTSWFLAICKMMENTSKGLETNSYTVKR